MMQVEKITFFRPEEVCRKSATLPAETYNHTRLLLNRGSLDCQFVPIRSLQYQAVISQHEIIFVDAQGYAVRDGEGGRLIVLAWQFDPQQTRDSLSDAVQVEVVHYQNDMDEMQRRLLVEFELAMRLMLERQLAADQPQQTMKVVAIGESRSPAP